MKMQKRKSYGNNGNDLENKLRKYLEGGKIRSLQKGSIAEQMAYELYLDGRTVSLPVKERKKLEYKPNKVTERAKNNNLYLGGGGVDISGEYSYLGEECEIKQGYADKVKWVLEAAFYYTFMGLFKGVAITLGVIEKASTNHLRKTRPDIANMIERGEDFSEVAKIYFQKQSP